MDAETTMDGVNAAEQTTATVNLVERIEDAHMHKRRRTNPTPDHVPSTNVWHHRPTQTEAPKLAPRRPPAKRRTHKRTRKAAKQDSDAIKQVNKRPAESETVSSESCKTKQDANSMKTHDSANSAATDRSTPAEDPLMDVETLTSATEFRLSVNEWLADIDAEETQAAGFNLAAYMDSPAVVKAPLSSIFGSALLPLLDDDTVNTY
ncbi:MAG: hypothetical protein FRX49_13458 [Trebouxia sp. A1-2]|nr:MAG: hypothetical protein FRX49_13458 [Trebouxia sp. A1-2]